ncbi:MAG: ABC transporter ATP-binding protein [Acidobacteria bacterium]|nr:MAG: ABC transporter ATP-binding protein [Acidobacteriota bacterium]
MAIADSALPQVTPVATPVIELENLRVRYGQRIALDGLTARLTGRAVGLLGPNGAGKSTLIATLLGFVKPAAGSARLLGQPIGRGRGKGEADQREARGAAPPEGGVSRVGYMPENDAFIGNMSAVALTRMMAELSGLPPETALERAHESLFYVGLGEARYRPLNSYSQGMRQMAKLAQAIVHGPKLLILDEPTNSLDPEGRERMLRLIRQMRDATGMRIILCSHLLRDVEQTCDEVLILKHGRAVHQTRLDATPPASRLLELETADDGTAFAATLASLGCEVARRGRRLKTVLPSGLELRDIYQAAAAANIQLRRVQFRRDTLEDIFLRAMDENGT